MESVGKQLDEDDFLKFNLTKRDFQHDEIKNTKF